MIYQISGKVLNKGDLSLILEVGGFCYEIFVPRIIMQGIDNFIDADSKIRLFTYHYHRVEANRSIPVLMGFLNLVEREFFELFISVSGIGCKAAIKALNMPISVIAQAIDEGNVSLLKTLPGIGQQRAKEIVAKLQGKVAKFGLVQDAGKVLACEPAGDFVQEALEILGQLQYSPKEAKEMVERAIKRTPEISTVEELLNEVYRQRAAK